MAESQSASRSCLNLGPGNASGVDVTDPLPIGTVFESANFAKTACKVVNGHLTCSTTYTPCAFNSGTVTCNIGDLAKFSFTNPAGAAIPAQRVDATPSNLLIRHP
ncbi:MAG TPA: hypothetical protein VOA64_14685 [Candidatus Dormibacteraeota bacterium]|nr:hypothetical protein [Candidatus Dormibacteraeota bacterium]